ncbi:MAG: NAD-dependent epimerase/dehydratase family protein [Sphingobacteriales bacterium]|nr:MAG: NAD-dependent epimerase/dehydratase family protein [Sphingobacteriales bacterium]
MSYLTAIVTGATGLTGTELVNQLLEDSRFEQVVVFVRRSTGISHPKLREHIIRMEKPEEWQHLVKGDVLFSAMGTTIAAAGSKPAQYRVDHTYQFWFAKAAADNQVPVYVLLSSAMANPDSRIFYTRMKGELERDILKLPFHYIRIIQPGMLGGDRKEHRSGEKMGMAILRFFNKLGLMKSQAPIHVSMVAKAMINASFEQEEKVRIYALKEVFHQAGKA